MPADSNDTQLFYQKGLKELWQENWSSALTYFQKAKEKNPQYLITPTGKIYYQRTAYGTPVLIRD